MKILFAIRDFRHFSYIQSVVDALNGHRITLLFDKDWCRHSTDEYVKQRGFKPEWMLTQGPKKRVAASFWRELRSYTSYIKRDQSDYYLKRWNSYLPKFVRWFVYFKLVRMLLPYFDRLFVAIERLTPTLDDVVEDLLLRKPDVVFTTPVMHRFSGEVEYLKAAKELGIPTVSMTLSWDNLTTKGVFAVKPDLMLVWNKTQKQEAEEIHGLENIEIIGAPFFDKWFHHRDTADRKEFCDRIGLNHKKPFVLYLGSSSKIAENENWLIQDIYNGLDGIGLLVRPHPANAKNYIKLAGNDFVSLSNNSLRVKDDFVVYPISGALPETEADQEDFYIALKQCVCVIGINTSAMIDAIINGKPCLTVITDKYRLTQEKATHFRQMVDANALDVTHTVEEAIETIGRLGGWRHDADKHWHERREFVKKFIRPRGFDVAAGKLAANAIEKIAKGKE